MKNIFIVLILVVCSVSHARANCSMERKSESEFNNCEKMAKQGDANSQYLLGNLYESGSTFFEISHAYHQDEDDKHAFKWYKWDADDKQAFKWYEKAAEQGNLNAQSILAKFYYEGRGTIKDDKQAFKWYKKVAEQGNIEAQYYIGTAYLYGRGTIRDSKQGLKWLKKTAQQGHHKSLFVLGEEMLRKRDYIMGYMYMSLSHSLSFSSAPRKYKNGIRKKKLLTSSQIEKSQDLAKRWLETHHIGLDRLRRPL